MELLEGRRIWFVDIEFNGNVPVLVVRSYKIKSCDYFAIRKSNCFETLQSRVRSMYCKWLVIVLRRKISSVRELIHHLASKRHSCSHSRRRNSMLSKTKLA